MGRSTAPGSQVIIQQGAFTQSTAKELQDAFCAGDFASLTGSADLLAYPGNTRIDATGVDAITLVAPASGKQPAGDDGKTIFLIDMGGHAHTVTAPANAIFPSHHLLTFGGTAGSFVWLIATGGVWVVAASSGVTAS